MFFKRSTSGQTWPKSAPGEVNLIQLEGPSSKLAVMLWDFAGDPALRAAQALFLRPN